MARGRVSKEEGEYFPLNLDVCIVWFCATGIASSWLAVCFDFGPAHSRAKPSISRTAVIMALTAIMLS